MRKGQEQAGGIRKSARTGVTLFLRLEVDGVPVMGPGRAALLAGVRELGSIAAAGRRLGMSYKRAWQLVEAMNATFAHPLVAAAKGGAGGGGATLTALGAEVLDAWDRVQAAAQAAEGEALNTVCAAVRPRT